MCECGIEPGRKNIFFSQSIRNTAKIEQLSIHRQLSQKKKVKKNHKVKKKNQKFLKQVSIHRQLSKSKKRNKSNERGRISEDRCTRQLYSLQYPFVSKSSTNDLTPVTSSRCEKLFKPKAEASGVVNKKGRTGCVESCVLVGFPA